MFKRYDQKQQFLLPLNLEEFVSEDHISRVLNDLIDVVDISAIESTYSENGCPAYHPRLFLKILFYGYLINIRSSRKIDDMTQTDTAFMYLAAMQKPDFHTICRFRSTPIFVSLLCSTKKSTIFASKPDYQYCFLKNMSL